MKILLINNNPVVSRLTALSARKEDIEIDEIQEVTELSSDTYDIVFIDAESWSKDVRDVILDNIKTQKSVLFYADGDEEEKASFDLSILKPFLPSEVSAVIRSVEEQEAKVENSSNKEEHFNILDEAKEDNSRDDLFTLDGLDELTEKKESLDFSLDETPKVKDENVSFDDKLEEAFPLKINSLEDDLFEDDLSLEKPDKKTNDELFDLNLSDEIPSLEDELFSEAKKEKVLDKKEETLDLMDGLELEEDNGKLALEIDELKLEELETTDVKTPEIKKETQILDELEIENIKDILTEDSTDDMSLEDLMPPMAVMPLLEKQEEKEEVEKKEKKKEEINNNVNVDSNVLAQTLTAMPVENLRELLAGATVKIKIKFPKSKK